jgi:hypothetical protein
MKNWVCSSGALGLPTSPPPAPSLSPQLRLTCGSLPHLSYVIHCHVLSNLAPKYMFWFPRVFPLHSYWTGPRHSHPNLTSMEPPVWCVHFHPLFSLFILHTAAWDIIFKTWVRSLDTQWLFVLLPTIRYLEYSPCSGVSFSSALTSWPLGSSPVTLFLFIQYQKLSPASGPLHQLFPLP